MEASVIFQVRAGDGLSQGSSNGGSEKWSESKILEGEMIGDRLDR